jgi:predicted acetyltransferase
MTPPDQTVSVAPARAIDRPLIAGLAQFYVYDFSEIVPASEAGWAITEAGTFGEIPHFDKYWTDEGRHVLLIRWQGEPAGFALLNTHSHLGGTVERNMGEFFIARRYRTRGIAQEAVAQVLAMFPGRWEVAVGAYNQRALAFWPKAIVAAPNVTGLTRREGDGTHWTGPVWCFAAGAKG